MNKSVVVTGAGTGIGRAIFARLLADGWHSAAAHQVEDASRLSVRRTSPSELATELAPILAQVIA